jgi:carbon starvation protein CstA
MSIIGFVLLMAAIIYGGDIAASETWGRCSLRRQAAHLD